ncbi:MAG: hypothetical protein KAI24_11095 [Planctomycetes bacterium]|nr:hypothetical protein [Planctomycetota bacterium]
MSRANLPSVATLTLLCALTSTQCVTAQDTPGYDEALARYQECIGRLPFRFHVEGRERLAGTRDAAAFEQLAKDYAKSKAYQEHARYTIAHMFGQHFKDEEWFGRFEQLRQKHDKPIDTWLWFHTLRNEIDKQGDAKAIEIAQTAKKAHQRAAAIAALGASSRGGLKQAIVSNCVDFPRKESDRMLLVGAMTGALHHNKRRVNDDDYREALQAYIGLLAKDVKLPQLAKVQMARHLQDILNGPAKFTDPEPWLELLSRGEVKKPKDYGTSAKPKFFGIETEGERFCYVLDMSDSMLKEIAPSARPKGPITGPKKARKKKSMVLDEGDLPWHQIRTRWDLAREQLRISLSRLGDDKYFSIVWFGNDADTIGATKGMVKASKGNIKKAMAELDSIQSEFTDGKDRLRGETSLHQGLEVAFGLTKRGVQGEDAYVGAKPLVEGCDTIFLLSDGTPNWDAFVVVDKNYGEGQTYSDLEAGIQAAATPQLRYPGPYAGFPQIQGRARPSQVDCWLLRDVRRMNAFRRIRLHCVGLGEANEALLTCLADIGNGEVFIVGKKK